MKCKNCGAELNNGRCEYCGSHFDKGMWFSRILPDKDDDSQMHKVEIIEVTCLGDTEPHFIEGWKYV